MTAKTPWLYVSILSAGLLVSFQNCGGTFSSARLSSNDGTANAADLSFATASLSPDQQLPQTMLNGLDKLADGSANPAFGKLIRNIVVTQIAGWSGLPSEEAADPTKAKIDKPLFGGASSYLSKTPAHYEKQARMIMALGNHMAAAVLLMDQGDSNASGYGACWNGTWLRDRSCQGGSFKFSQDLYTQFKQAARKQGLQVIPNFSIMNWEQPNAYDGARFLPKLRAFLNWARPLFDGNNVKTIDGKWVVIVDSLPETAGLSKAQKKEVHAFMASQNDIFWLDNAVSPIDGLLAPGAANIYGSGWGTLPTQNLARKNWNNHFLYWVAVLKQGQRDYVLAQNPAYQYSNSILEEELNIINYRADKYPVVISQWNEYAENLYFEPAEGIGFTNYNRLKQWVSRQGPDPVPYVPAQASDFADPNPSPDPGTTPGPVDPIPTPPVTVDYAGIVSNAFKDILERTPDSEGLKYYIELMKNGRSEAEVRQDLKSSLEFTFKNYYKTYLLRLPTLTEIATNNSDITSGKVTLAQLQSSLRQPPTCKAQCLPTYKDTIIQAFNDLLERAPDDDGLAYYIGLMRSGRSEAQIHQDLMSSHEYTFKNYYKSYLLRLPSLTEIVQANDDLSSKKMTLSQLQTFLRNSLECKALCHNPSPAPSPSAYIDTVTNLYLSVLEREPDNDGLTYYAGQLKDGIITETKLRQTLTASMEYIFKDYYKLHLQRLPFLSEIVRNNGDISASKITQSDLKIFLQRSPECKVTCL